jgi:type II secretion system protein J
MRFAICNLRFAIGQQRRCAPSIANRNSQIANGFTLIELVVALLMVAILASSMYASLRIAFRAQASAEAAVEPARTADLAMEMLRDDIQNAFPPSTTETQINKVFYGSDATDERGANSDTLEFCSTADAREHASANGEIKHILLHVNAPANTSDHVLVRSVSRNLLTVNAEPTVDDEVICRGVGAFNLRYYDGTSWQDTWNSDTSTIPLPLAVEVTLQLDRPGPNDKTRSIKYVRVFPLACATTTTTDGSTQ